MQQEIPIEIKIDKNPNLEYEKRGWAYLLFLPVMAFTTIWVFLKKQILGPKLGTNAFWFDELSPKCREIRENATSWKALDIIYNYIPPKNPNFSERVTDFWNHLASVRATRNRLRLTKHLLKKEIQKLLNNSSEVRLISVASGSAQGVIEVMAELKNKAIKAVFLDLDETALEHSKKLAEKAGIGDQIRCIKKSARDLEQIARKFRPQIIEVVGFLMYRPEKRAIKLIERIHGVLPSNGTLLISQDNHMIEKLFLYYVADWPLIFRSPKKFCELLIEGGFEPRECEIIYEPLNMHGIAVCKKST